MAAALLALAALLPVVAPRPPADVCAAMPAADVQAALHEGGLPATVTAARPGGDACTYTFSDPGLRLMIDVARTASPEDARAALATLRAQQPSARTLGGVADEAFLVDEGPYGRISVKYRAGAAYGQVTLRAEGPAREAAVVAVARLWGERAGRASEPRPAPPPPPVAAPTPAPAPVAEAVPPPDAPRPPLPPLRWADPDSVARARGLAPWTNPPTLPAGVPPAAAAARMLFAATGADSLFGAAALEMLEAQVLEAEAWGEAQDRRDRERGDTSTGSWHRRPDAPPLSAEPGGGRSGPAAPNEPAIVAPASASRTILRRPEPTWFRDESTLDPDPIQGPDGITGTVRGERVSFQEPWVTGEDQTIEFAFAKTDGRVTATYSYGWREGSTVALCPGTDGLVTGTATGEFFAEFSGQAGSRPFRRRVAVVATSEITARVGDDAVLQSYDLFTTVTTTASRTSSGGDYPMFVETTAQVAQTGIDPGIQWSDGDPGSLTSPNDFDVWGSTPVEIPDGTDGAFAAAVGFGLIAAGNGVERAFRNWWQGGCQEVRLADAPVRTRLRHGESTPFELEVWHYQDAAMAALPIEVTAPVGDARLGEVAPERSADSPARFTFTAPREADARDWRQTEVSSRSVSRRGRSEVFRAPTFQRRTGREQFLVMARTRVTSSRLGTVQNVTFIATLETDPRASIPGTLRADGGFHGFLVSNDANCLDGLDLPPSTETLSGRLNTEDAASVLEVGGSRRLLLSLTASLPPRHGLERGIAFSWLDGVPLPPSGSTEPVTLRKTLPHGFTGVVPDCEGDVQTIYDVTVMPMGD